MRARNAAMLVLLLSVVGPAVADPMAPREAPALSTRPVKAVVELFTSQGCSSCPPADALLKTYTDSKDVMALSLPVDYWDYIGWKDTFASPRNTARQRAYAKQLGLGPVFTPQIVVNGRYQAVGSNRTDVDAAIDNAATTFVSAQVPVHFWHQRNQVVIETGVAPQGASGKDATIWLVLIQKTAAVPIKRGENSGKTLTYHNVVREMTQVGIWNGKAMSLRLARTSVLRPDVEDSVVLIQEGDTGTIIGAAWLGP